MIVVHLQLILKRRKKETEKEKAPRWFRTISGIVGAKCEASFKRKYFLFKHLSSLKEKGKSWTLPTP